MRQAVDRMLKGRTVWIALLAIFLFRLVFGLCSEFWFEDELQVYLIGLKCYTGGHIPDFGPDVVYTATQIPGSLQGLLVALPWWLWPAPEAPYILLNLMSTAGLALLAWYITKRIPGLPVGLTWLWIMTCPWALAYSTHVVNPSYVLPAACVFFVTFLESLPRLRLGLIRQRVSFLLMGLCLMWIFQLHLSWVLLMPFIAVAFIMVLRQGWREVLILGGMWTAGCCLSGLTLLPLLLEHGLKDGLLQAGGNVVVNWSNAGQIVTLLSRMLSLVCFELARFMGANSHERGLFFMHYLWLSPVIVFVGIVGLLQPVWLIVAAFLKKMPRDFKQLRWIVLGIFVFTWISFFFSVKGPSSHTFYLLFPLLMIYSFYAWKPLLEMKYGRAIATALVLAGLLFHTVLMYDNFAKKSMYRDREKVVRALEEKDYRVLGERRPYDRNK